MNNTVELDSQDRKKLYLSMMDEIDGFCRKNNIRYSLACGTLLGAIRHKGFIPWDDDLDIMMPLPDMIKFKESFKSNNNKYVDIDTEKGFLYAFSQIENLHTRESNSGRGLSIDLYPILGLPQDDIEIESFLHSAQKICDKRLFLIKWADRFQRYLHLKPDFNILSKMVERYRDFMFQYPYSESLRFYYLGGYPKWRAVFNKDYLQNIIDVSFEGRLYCCISEYDEYLTQVYGAYMQFPPEHLRHPYHCGRYYWVE